MKLFLAIIFICCVSGFPTENSKNNLTETKYDFYTRKDWGAVPPVGSEPLRSPVEYVVIHHTYIPAACNTTDQCSADMRAMQRYHNSLDWGDIGYNFCVGSEGGAYEGRGWFTKGAHARAANSFSIGICLIGDWRVELPPQQQLETTKALIASGLDQGVLKPDYKLIGHLQATGDTECPGGALQTEISKWKHYVPGHIPFQNKVNL